VWGYILKNYYKLKPSPAVKTELKKTADNPKRRQREVEKQRKFELRQQKRKEKHRGH
jgi:hypothetical protein